MYSVSFLIAALVSSATARSLVLEHVPELPTGWTQTEQAINPDKLIKFSIALRQPSIDKFTSLFTPGAKHLTKDEANALREPDAKDVAAVMTWLTENGITNAEHKHDTVEIRTTVQKAEKLLEAKLNHYNFDNKVTAIRAQKYAVPEHLNGAIDFVYPISHFMDPVREPAVPTAASLSDNRLASAADAACSRGVTPKCLKQLYNINYKPADNKPKSRFGISGYLEENGNYKDVASFLKSYAPDLSKAGYNFTIETVNGGKDAQTPAGGEAQLDIEYGMGIGYPSAVTYYATGGRGQKLDDNGKPVDNSDNEPYLEFIQSLLDKPDDQVPHVLSVSYGDDELTVPQAYAERVCKMYGLLTKRGTSIIHSSGDGGAAGGRQGTCKSKDGKNTETAMATFPAGCPWVTSIGATTNTAEPPSGAAFSSGGFSQYFTRPSWQDKAVPPYIKKINGLMDGYYPKGGRGIPDITAVGTSFTVVVGGFTQSIGGTSASAPVIAAMISLVNDARIRKGKQSIGFLNEILYSDKIVSILQDVTKGTSYGCKFSTGSPGGWPAKDGWDAITGLGVPKDFQKFFDALVAA